MDVQTVALNIAGTAFVTAATTMDLPAVVTVVAGVSIIILNVVKAAESWARRQSIKRHGSRPGVNGSQD